MVNVDKVETAPVAKMFEINLIDNVQVEYLQDSAIFTINNFFKEPDKLVNLLHTQSVPLWKAEESKNNGTKFIDKRHTFEHTSVGTIQLELTKFTKQSPYIINQMYSNYFRMLDKEFNDYENKYWWPHTDIGYTAIVYLNDFKCPGTNLYDIVGNDNTDTISEHEMPWRDNCNYKIAKTIQSEYNKLVLFDGLKFFHGMAITENIFFTEERLNLVMFFNANS